MAQNVQECTAEVRETEPEEGCGERTQEISHLEKGGRVSMKVLEDMVQRRQEKSWRQGADHQSILHHSFMK